jgi:hypothetical protein
MPPLKPDIADHAPDGPALTKYDEEHVVTYIMLKRTAPIGAKSPVLCCISIPRRRRTARGLRLIPTSHAPKALAAQVIASCSPLGVGPPEASCYEDHEAGSRESPDPVHQMRYGMWRPRESAGLALTSLPAASKTA